MTRREDISIQMGVDNSQIDNQLAMTTRKTDAARDRQKRAEMEYTEFWKRELQKRDDAARDADVRAATRANRARQLQRQRETERTTRLNAELGAGSVPENMRGGAGLQRAMADTAVATGSLAAALRGLRSFFGFSALATIGAGIMEGFDRYTQALGRVMFKQPATDLKGQIFEENRQRLRREVAERDEAEAKRKRDAQDRIKEAEEFISKQDDLARVRREIRVLEAKGDKEKAEVQKKNLATEVGLADLELERARMTGDRVKIKDAEVKKEQAILNLKQAQNQLDAINIAERDAKNKPIRDKLAGAFGAGQFTGHIDRMLELQSDMAIASRSGNLSGFERLRSSAAQFNIVRKSLQDRMGDILRTDPKKDAREALMGQILDIIAPMSKEGGVPVTIRNTE